MQHSSFQKPCQKNKFSLLFGPPVLVKSEGVLNHSAHLIWRYWHYNEFVHVKHEDIHCKIYL